MPGAAVGAAPGHDSGRAGEVGSVGGRVPGIVTLLSDEVIGSIGVTPNPLLPDEY
jgi:hypothetical protein